MKPIQPFTVTVRTDIPVDVREVAWHEGDVVRKLRQATGWGLKELGERSGVDFTTIHNIEMGHTKEPKRGTLERLARAFGLTWRDIADLVPSQAVRLDVPAPQQRTPARVRSKKGAA